MSKRFNMNNKIGIFDSGIGGTTILNELRNLLPSESFIYYADSKNNPYGEKSDEELFKMLTSPFYFNKMSTKSKRASAARSRSIGEAVTVIVSFCFTLKPFSGLLITTDGR